MRRYQKGRKELIRIKMRLAKMSQDLLYAEGKYLPPIPSRKKITENQFQEFMDKVKKPFVSKGKKKKFNNPIKTITKREIKTLLSQNDN